MSYYFLIIENWKLPMC